MPDKQDDVKVTKITNLCKIYKNMVNPNSVILSPERIVMCCKAIAHCVGIRIVKHR